MKKSGKGRNPFSQDPIGCQDGAIDAPNNMGKGHAGHSEVVNQKRHHPENKGAKGAGRYPTGKKRAEY